jgi:hypothetical protein
MEQALTTVKLDEATTQYDADFQRVQGLTWLPWVGHRFSERPPNQRLLVVGESHYFRGDTPEQRQADREEYLKFSHRTREQVSDSHINREWTTPTLTNIPKLLFNTTEIDRPKFWGDSAYYNFVQRPMNHHEKETPSPDDFVVGWKVFAEVVRIVQPSHCLFIGVTAANYFNLGIVSRHEKVDGVWPRVAKLEIPGTTTKLIFVHHLARCKNLSQWHDYLQAQHADFMKWLETESYVINRSA